MLLLLKLGVLGMAVLRRLPLSLLRSLLLLILVVAALLLCKILTVQLSVARTRARCRLLSKLLISVRTLRLLNNWRVVLVLVLIGLLLWLLRTLVLVGAVVIYPALLLIATFSAYSVEWGPIVLILVWSKVLRVLLILNIFRRDLRCGILLEERVEPWAAFVLLD